MVVMSPVLLADKAQNTPKKARILPLTTEAHPTLAEMKNDFSYRVYVFECSNRGIAAVHPISDQALKTFDPKERTELLHDVQRLEQHSSDKKKAPFTETRLNLEKLAKEDQANAQTTSANMPKKLRLDFAEDGWVLLRDEIVEDLASRTNGLPALSKQEIQEASIEQLMRAPESYKTGADETEKKLEFLRPVSDDNDSGEFSFETVHPPSPTSKTIRPTDDMNEFVPSSNKPGFLASLFGARGKTDPKLDRPPTPPLGGTYEDYQRAVQYFLKYDHERVSQLAVRWNFVAASPSPIPDTGMSCGDKEVLDGSTSQEDEQLPTGTSCAQNSSADSIASLESLTLSETDAALDLRTEHPLLSPSNNISAVSSRSELVSEASFESFFESDVISGFDHRSENGQSEDNDYLKDASDNLECSVGAIRTSVSSHLPHKNHDSDLLFDNTLDVEHSSQEERPTEDYETVSGENQDSYDSDDTIDSISNLPISVDHDNDVVIQSSGDSISPAPPQSEEFESAPNGNGFPEPHIIHAAITLVRSINWRTEDPEVTWDDQMRELQKHLGITDQDASTVPPDEVVPAAQMEQHASPVVLRDATLLTQGVNSVEPPKEATHSESTEAGDTNLAFDSASPGTPPMAASKIGRNDGVATAEASDEDFPDPSLTLAEPPDMTRTQSVADPTVISFTIPDQTNGTGGQTFEIPLEPAENRRKCSHFLKCVITAREYLDYTFLAYIVTTSFHEHHMSAKTHLVVSCMLLGSALLLRL
ncbi:hypothetical protein BU23DRAFT_234743 [Bimuria novae-zelandiae CBS 107.79]|uniref:Uncharacterized protein n=1 Tax=Bimuria novae-zelandiae CBS 107.79 TaxID=1447943 RepID=A0A6A5V3M2_9PLEO|nr:hypothetical protein BU23DRAFT_234743 [Bimuria novae-zelandiae CBS 107.79]